MHLALRPGTNLPLLLGLQHLLFARGWIDGDYVARATVGAARLEAAVRTWTPQHTAHVCGLRVAEVEAAAELLGTCEALTSTVLQGFYQPIRRPRRPARSTTCICCAACSDARAPACSR